MQRAARLIVACTWAYHGIWCKLLRREPSHLRIIAAIPWIGAERAAAVAAATGTVEALLAVRLILAPAGWRWAVLQSAALAAMNGAALYWAPVEIPNPRRLLATSGIFLVLAWIAARSRGQLP